MASKRKRVGKCWKERRRREMKEGIEHSNQSLIKINMLILSSDARSTPYVICSSDWPAARQLGTYLGSWLILALIYKPQF